MFHLKQNQSIRFWGADFSRAVQYRVRFDRIILSKSVSRCFFLVYLASVVDSVKTSACFRPPMFPSNEMLYMDDWTCLWPTRHWTSRLPCPTACRFHIWISLIPWIVMDFCCAVALTPTASIAPWTKPNSNFFQSSHFGKKFPCKWHDDLPGGISRLLF